MESVSHMSRWRNSTDVAIPATATPRRKDYGIRFSKAKTLRAVALKELQFAVR